MYVKSLLLLVLLWNPALPAVAQIERATDEAALMGRLLAEAIDCGEPFEDLRPYIGYVGLVLANMYDVQTRQEADELKATMMKSFEDTLSTPPPRNCNEVFKNLDDLKRACQRFYHSLPESRKRSLNLDPLPPPE